MAGLKTSRRAMANARAAYEVELARGCSYIGSTLTPETRQFAIAEVLGDFRRLYGDRELVAFQRLLVEELHQRGKAEDATATSDFKFTG